MTFFDSDDPARKIEAALPPEAPKGLLPSSWMYPEDTSTWSEQPRESGITGVFTFDDRVDEDHSGRFPEQSEKTELKVNIGYAQQSLYGEDSVLYDSDDQIFVVADGLGNEDNGVFASQAAVRGMGLVYDGLDPGLCSVEQAEDYMRMAFVNARQHANESGIGGLTTLTSVKIQQTESGKYAIWGHAGNTRLYVQRQNGLITQVTRVQRVAGGVVSNALGRGYSGVSDEFGAFELQEGDRIVLCTASITGDEPHQFLTKEEIFDAFAQPSAQASADRFLELSKKPDDKSVIVLDIF